MHIPPPTNDRDPENRHLLCQHAVESAVKDLVATAVASGWEEEEVLAAISDVSDHLMLKNAASEEFIRLLRDIHAARFGNSGSSH